MLETAFRKVINGRYRAFRYREHNDTDDQLEEESHEYKP